MKDLIKLLEQNNSSLKRAIERSNDLVDWCYKLGGTPQNHDYDSVKTARDAYWCYRLGGTPQNQGQFVALLECTIDDNNKKIAELKKS